MEENTVFVRVEGGIAHLVDKPAGVRVVIEDVDEEAEVKVRTNIFPTDFVVRNGEEIGEAKP